MIRSSTLAPVLALVMLLPIGCGSSDDSSPPAPQDNDAAVEADASIPPPESGPEADGAQEVNAPDVVDAAQEPHATDGPDEADAMDAADVQPEATDESMKVGEVREIAAEPDGTIHIDVPTPDGTEAYIAVLYSANWKPNTQYGYQLAIAPQAPTPSPLTARCPESSPAAGAGPQVGAEARPLPPLHRAGVGPLPEPAPPPAPSAPPVIGEHRKFKVMNADNTAVLEVRVECIKVGAALAIWLDLDTQLPAPAAIDSAKLDPIASGFEDTVLARHRIFFGHESDVDQDGLFHILFTPIFANTGVVAYVTQCDLVQTLGCPALNHMELIYATPPDQIGSPMMSATSSILEVTAHESQHDIYFYRKYMLNSQTNASENPYILEALAGLGEDLSGYGNGTFYVWADTLTKMQDVSGPDLIDSSISAYITARDAPLRGGGYLFYRYLYDQKGANGFATHNTIDDKGGVVFLHQLMDSPELGKDNIEKLMARPILDVMFDWYTALAVSNRPGPGGQPFNTDPQFNYLPVTYDPDTQSSSGKPERHGVGMFDVNPMTQQPLSGPTITEAAQADNTIRAGGVDYLRLHAAAAGGALGTVVTGDAGSNLRVRLIREK